MSLLGVFTLALRAMRRNVLRTILTTLGVLIGVAAVVAVIAIGEAAGRSVQASIRDMGSNVLMVFPGGMWRGGVAGGQQQNLTDEDGWAIGREVRGIAAVSPMVSTGGQIVAAGQNWNTTITGASHDYLTIKAWALASGSFFTESQMRGGAKVCVIGATVAAQLFSAQDPVGQVIRVRRVPFRILGVLTPRGANSWGMDQDDCVIAPYTAVQKKLQRGGQVGSVRQLMIGCEDAAGMPEAVRQITDLLRQRHKIAPGMEDDFMVRSQADIAQAAASTAKVFQGLLAGIASISLLVGGIGIMNIMLVSVRERTREIGIRMAVGARRRDILRQFLVEAVAISCAGGLLGLAIAGGVLLPVAGLALGSTFGSIPPSLSLWSVLLAIGFSSAVGVFFGWYPARTASRLDPIDCLRYE